MAQTRDFHRTDVETLQRVAKWMQMEHPPTEPGAPYENVWPGERERLLERLAKITEQIELRLPRGL